MHSQRMVHGDLKGVRFREPGSSLSLIDLVKANILIDENGRACLADFGLLAIISDGTSHTSSGSLAQGGTFRWMSPELFYPENFGLKDSRRTKRSDCYALGMVIYEVLSGQVPFNRCDVYAVVAKVGGGERPGRPRGAEGERFTNGVWRILERCWTPNPDDRPRIEDVLRCLEEASGFWTSLSQMVANPPIENSPTQDFSDPDTEESTGESEAPSQSQPSQTLPLKGDADEKTPTPTLPDLFTVPYNEVTNNRVPGAYVEDPSELDPKERVAALDRVGWDVTSRCWLFELTCCLLGSACRRSLSRNLTQKTDYPQRSSRVFSTTRSQLERETIWRRAVCCSWCGGRSRREKDRCQGMGTARSSF
jgi:serine/threonine protein kinase